MYTSTIGEVYTTTAVDVYTVLELEVYMPVGFPDYYGGLTLPVTVEEGGTGQTSLTQYGVLFGEGTSGVGVTLAGAIGDVLQVPSGGGAPVFQPLDISLATLSGILPIANGGTGTSSPGLVAGTNIAIGGSWPGQTIALASSPTIAGFYFDATNQRITAATGVYLDAYMEPHWASGAGLGEAWAVWDTNGVDTLIVYTDGTKQVNVPGYLTIGTPLAIAYGGTGASSLAAAKIANAVAEADGAGSTTGVPLTTIYTAPAAGYYRFSASLYIDRASGNSIGVFAAVQWTERTHVLTQTAATIATATSGTPNDSGDAYMYCDAGSAIKYEVTTQGTFGAGDSVDYDVTLEQIR